MSLTDGMYLVATLTIASGNSNVLAASELPKHGTLTFYGPAAAAGTLTIQISCDAGSTFNTLQSPPGTDVTIAATKAIVLDTGERIGFDQLRIHSSSADNGVVVKVYAPRE